MIHYLFLRYAGQIWKKEAGTSVIVYVCGDAYVDHPSFGSAIISRVLESYGYKVWDHRPAGLEGQREHPGSRKTASRLPRERRKYGLHGKTIIPSQRDAAIRIPTRRAALWESGRITRSGLLQPDPFRL